METSPRGISKTAPSTSAWLCRTAVSPSYHVQALFAEHAGPWLAASRVNLSVVADLAVSVTCSDAACKQMACKVRLPLSPGCSAGLALAPEWPGAVASCSPANVPARQSRICRTAPPLLGGTVSSLSCQAVARLQQHFGMLVFHPLRKLPRIPTQASALPAWRSCWHAEGHASRLSAAARVGSHHSSKPELGVQMANWGSQEQLVKLLLEGAEAWGSANATTLASPHRLDTNSLDEPNKVTWQPKALYTPKQLQCRLETWHGACWSSSPHVLPSRCSGDYLAPPQLDDVEQAGLHLLASLMTPSVCRCANDRASCHHADMPPRPGNQCIACLAASRRTQTLPI